MTSRPTVLYLGGNGHAPVRLEPARRAIDALPPAERMEILDLVYPGFAGLAPANGFEEFLEGVSETAEQLVGVRDDVLVHATGIGAMVALALRSRGQLIGLPTVFLGPVLWGLEERCFPRLMRVPGIAGAVARAIQLGPVQRRFERAHFGSHVSAELRARFFAGYAECRHFADLFRWFTPAYLRVLEQRLDARAGALSDIELWWGAGDAVVGEREADVTEAALGVHWPRRTFASWGHYPMINDAPGWVREVRRALAAVDPAS